MVSIEMSILAVVAFLVVLGAIEVSGVFRRPRRHDAGYDYRRTKWVIITAILAIVGLTTVSMQAYLTGP
ncbi:hypothetical protein [Haloarchaeobius sp. HRN-SO-5]|uniref:hypothetical protein n=1 Tax=Haloarchaeobius sp. HRN-SO-5 TaxID=3446118 RepID=UPI003EBD649A